MEKISNLQTKIEIIQEVAIKVLKFLITFILTAWPQTRLYQGINIYRKYMLNWERIKTAN